MQSSNKIKDYLNKLCQQIRWKKSHEIISEEIEDHIIDQKETFMSQGMDEETATDKAILEMGDPIQVGTELDSVYRPQPQWTIIILTAVMLVLGVIIRSFITQGDYLQRSLSMEISYTIIGIGIMGLAYFMDFTILGKYPKLIYSSLILLTLGSMLFSPRFMGQSYYTKYLVLLFPTVFAGIIYDMRDKGYKGLMISLVFMFIPVLIFLRVPSMSNLILYMTLCIFLLTYAILKGYFNVKKPYALGIVYGPTIGVLLARLFTMETYQMARIKIALNPYTQPYGDGYILVNVRNFIANAKIIGTNPALKNIEEVLPAINTDFILTNLIYSFGWLAFIILMGLVLFFIVKSAKISLKHKGLLGRLVSISVIATFSMQAVFYLINNLGIIYFDPIDFPLIANGKAGLMINMLLIGVMLSVYKSKALSGDEEKLTKRTSRKDIHIS